MAVLGRLEVDWVGKVELLDDDTRSQVKVVLDYLNELVGRFVGCAVCLNEDGKGLGDTDGVGELDERTASEASGNEGLGWRRPLECTNPLLKRDAPIHRAV